MDLTIHTYGHIDAMYYVLNGIAMILGSKFADLMIQAIAVVTTAYYGLRMVASGTTAGMRPYLTKIMLMVLAVNVLLAQKTTMFVEDHVSKQRDNVDNIPWGFAVPVGFMESFGDIQAAAFEQGFSVVGSNSYRDYGMLFGARLVQEARNFKIQTPEFAYNMDNFIRKCVVKQASIGNKYTINELFQKDDVWKLVSDNASRLFRVEIRDGKNHELMTCKDAADKVLAPAFVSELDILEKKYLKSDFGLAGNLSGFFGARGKIAARSYFKKNLADSFNAQTGSGLSAETTLRQYIMMNSMSDWGRNYGYSRASMTQESNWRIAGDLANEYLPILLSVMKGIVYASFIFMVPLMLMSGGGAKYLGYISVVASLQLWPALNAILNLFIELYSSSHLQDIAGGAVSFASYSKIGDYADKIVAVASGLQMTIPFLAFNIVQGGVSGFIHLASNITGASASAASTAAGEVVTGNRSFDNYSSGNMQIANNQGFKTDLNSSYKAGASEWQHADGTMERVLPDGSSILQSGAGLTMSGGSVKLAMRESQSGQVLGHLSDAQNLLQSEQRSYHESERETFSKTANYVSNLAQRESEGKTFDYSVMGEQGKALQKAVNQVHTLRESYGYSWDQAARASLEGKVPIPLGNGIGSIIAKGIGGSAGKVIGALSDSSLNIDGSVSATNSSSQSFGDDNQINREQFTREDYNNVVKVASNEQFASSNNVDKSYSEGVSRSYEKQKLAEIAMNTQADRVESLSKAYQQIQSLDASYDKDMYDVVQKNIAKTYGVTQSEAHKMIEGHDPRALRMWNGMVSSEVNKIVGPQMSAAQVKFSDANRKEFLQNSEDQNRRKIETDHTKGVIDVATSQGIDPNNAGFVTNTVQAKVVDMRDLNDQQYTTARNENEAKEQVRQGAINQYEEGRIGQGTLGSIIGIGGPRNPSTISAQEGKSEIRELATQVPQGTKK